jgi:D-sedoheptulose 7-phosphate isomerase
MMIPQSALIDNASKTSASGRSLNVLACLKAAREIGVVTIGFTGASNSAKAMLVSSDFLLIVPAADTPLIQLTV